MATLKLSRANEAANRLAPMTILLNGKPLGMLENGETKEIDVPAGKHRLQVRVDAQGSKPASFRVAANETRSFVLSAGKGPGSLVPLTSGFILLDLLLNGVLLLYYFTIGHNRYLKIEPANAIFT